MPFYRRVYDAGKTLRKDLRNNFLLSLPFRVVKYYGTIFISKIRLAIVETFSQHSTIAHDKSFWNLILRRKKFFRENIFNPTISLA